MIHQTQEIRLRGSSAYRIISRLHALIESLLLYAQELSAPVLVCIDIVLVNIACDFSKQGLADRELRFIKDGKVNIHLMVCEIIRNGLSSHLKRLGLWIAVYPTGDQREGDTLTLVFLRQFKSLYVGRA